MFSFSRMIGANSNDRTVVYNMRHQLISHITECVFHMTSGCQKWSGRPRSMMRTRTTSRYPMKAVRIAGRTMGSYSFAWNRLTAATMVNPEAARPIPRKSNPIQSPQGNSSLRLVVAPSPNMNRAAAARAPPKIKVVAIGRHPLILRRPRILMGCPRAGWIGPVSGRPQRPLLRCGGW